MPRDGDGCRVAGAPNAEWENLVMSRGVQGNRVMMNIVIAVLAALGVTLYFGAPVTAFLCAAALGIVALFVIDILAAR